tara:strand:+ start:2148 stop:2849 length:702 start_codon:yes stop_codon:yes gene_type:complete
MTITTRAGKGSQLTHAELDTNFTDLRDGVDMLAPKEKTKGIRIDPTTPDFGWHDIIGQLHVDEDDATNKANFATYRGSIKARQFGATSEAFVDFHIPHDYYEGSPIYINVHWSHTSSTLTGGSVTWGMETMYAKGHDQAAFAAPVTITVAQTANTTQYQHMIAETAASTAGGSGVQLDTNLLEVDGVIQCRIYLDSNDLTDSVTVPDPFVHFVDIHYQSTGLPTKSREPDFYT